MLTDVNILWIRFNNSLWLDSVLIDTLLACLCMSTFDITCRGIVEVPPSLLCTCALCFVDSKKMHYIKSYQACEQLLGRLFSRFFPTIVKIPHVLEKTQKYAWSCMRRLPNGTQSKGDPSTWRHSA